MNSWKRTEMRVYAFLGAGGAVRLGPRRRWRGWRRRCLSMSSKRIRLTESAEMRLEAISFFVAALLISPLVVRWFWNSVAKNFPRMPRINYGRSLALVVIWGLLFLVVLTMIAGTRELMTPGTWQKQGLLYKLPASQSPATPEAKPGSSGGSARNGALRCNFQQQREYRCLFSVGDSPFVQTPVGHGPCRDSQLAAGIREEAPVLRRFTAYHCLKYASAG